jgi:CubicO group peptidase (beta-lactamase class C family)
MKTESHRPANDEVRVIVYGGRKYVNRMKLFETLDAFQHEKGPLYIIHGNAKGADTLAGDWAILRKRPSQAFPAEWSRYGNRAGPIRNEQMLKEGKPQYVIAFPGGRGTGHMIRIAREAGIPVIVIRRTEHDTESDITDRALRG